MTCKWRGRLTRSTATLFLLMLLLLLHPPLLLSSPPPKRRPSARQVAPGAGHALPPRYAAAASAGNCFFVAGGNCGISYLDTVEMYDGLGAWRMLPSLNIKRNGAALALVGDVLYCAGGFDGDMDCLSVTEKLDLSRPLAHEPWRVAGK